MNNEIIDGQETFNQEKQTLSDSILTFLPKNTAGYTYKNQLVELQVPKTPYLLRMNKAYFDVEMNVGYRIEGAAFDSDGKTLNSGGHPSHVFVGLINSATIFDQIQISNNGSKCRSQLNI